MFFSSYVSKDSGNLWVLFYITTVVALYIFRFSAEMKHSFFHSYAIPTKLCFKWLQIFWKNIEFKFQPIRNKYMLRWHAINSHEIQVFPLYAIDIKQIPLYYRYKPKPQFQNRSLWLPYTFVLDQIVTSSSHKRLLLLFHSSCLAMGPETQIVIYSYSI